MQTLKTPLIGQSVFIPFVTTTDIETGKTMKLKGAALIPFDTIEAIYAGTSKTQTGKNIYSVRVKSGDVVDIVDKDDKWQAIN